MSEGLPPPGDRPTGGPVPPPGDGLGTSSSDVPSFHTGHPPPPAAAALPHPSSVLPPRAPSPVPPVPAPSARPRQTRLPAVLTTAAVVVVVAVVAVGTAMARYADTHVPAAPPSARPATAATPTAPLPVPGSIEFRTRRGAGRLVVLSHTWVPAAPADRSGSQLRIRLELVCTEGRVDYAPEYFSLFDTDGHLVELSGRTMGPGPLPFGRLGPGERVRGVVAFDVPRGDVTLVMGDDVSSVTAIRVTD
jgi:hypothetical protein